MEPKQVQTIPPASQLHALPAEVESSIRLHKAPACALRASLCSPSPTHRGQLDTRAFSAKRKIELLVARFLRAGGSWRKSWNDARCCSGGERLAIGTMYPGGIPGPGLIFEAL